MRHNLLLRLHFCASAPVMADHAPPPPAALAAPGPARRRPPGGAKPARHPPRRLPLRQAMTVRPTPPKRARENTANQPRVRAAQPHATP